jgi:hypothetical protein
LLTRNILQARLPGEKAHAKDADNAAKAAGIWTRIIYAKYTTIVLGLVTRNFPLTSSIRRYGR